MDDDFLYALRVDPSRRFAVRLKARLDRGSQPARKVAAWALTFLLCGTAFALVLPDVRHSFARLFTGAPHSARPAIVQSPSPGAADRVAAPDRSAVGESSPPTAASTSPTVRSRRSPAPPTTRSSVARTVPLPPEGAIPQDVATPADLLPPAPVVMPRIISLTAAESGQTPDELARQAVAAVATRRGLFRVINWAATPVLQMTQNQVPVEARQVAASALRIQSLAGMIPALYAIDTRPFPVETQSLDKIWGDLQGFDRNVDELADAAYALAAAARSDDKQAITQAARRVGTACSACHAAYRKPEGARQE